MGDSFSIILSVLILGYGVYGLYGAYQMKKTGIPPTMLVKAEVAERARDLEGYSRAMFKPFLIFCVLVIISSIISLINTFLYFIFVLEWVWIIILAVAIVYLGVICSRFNNKYLKY